MDRRTLLAAVGGAALAPLVGAGPARAQQSEVLRLGGELTAGTYPGFEAFLFNSVDEVVGLEILVARNDDYADGRLMAGVDDRGQFVAYLARGGGRGSEVVANEGFGGTAGTVTFDGFFVVKNAGMQQGITSLFLERAEEAAVLLSGRPIKDVSIDRLDPRIREN